MKLVLVSALCLLIYYIHTISSEPSTAKKPVDKLTKERNQRSAKQAADTTSKTKDKSKEFKKSTSGSTKTKDKSKVPMKDATKAKRTPQIRTPFDKVLDKLSNCASSSPSLVEVMEENLKELQSDEKYASLFHAAPHTGAFLKKKKKDSTKFIVGLQQALAADWSNPAWKSADEIDTLFRPFKQQFVYAMMRFNCTS